MLKLYKGIASKLGSSVPDARLGDLARDIIAFEADYQRRIAYAAACEYAPTAVDVIVSPRVLCVSSEQFMRLRVEDFQIIQKAFPDTVAHRQVLTSADARNLLMSEHFDIVHVATFICPKTGDLVFSDVDPQTGDRVCLSQDFLTAEAFAFLLKNTRASLVVIASCESFRLAATLLTATNVVATRDIVTPTMFATWVESFYGVLTDHALFEAFDFAVKASRAPMKLYAKHDLKISPAIKHSSAVT